MYNIVILFELDLLGSDDSSDEDESGDESGSGDDEGDAEEEDAKRVEEMEIIDKTETNLVALRRLIYLTIQSRFPVISFFFLFFFVDYVNEPIIYKFL